MGVRVAAWAMQLIRVNLPVRPVAPTTTDPPARVWPQPTSHCSARVAQPFRANKHLPRASSGSSCSFFSCIYFSSSFLGFLLFNFFIYICYLIFIINLFYFISYIYFSFLFFVVFIFLFLLSFIYFFFT
jgi:hypothetical protein